MTNTNEIKAFDLPEMLLRSDLSRLLYKHLGVSEEDQYQYIQDSSSEQLELRLQGINSIVKIIEIYFKGDKAMEQLKTITGVTKNDKRK